MGVIQTIKDWIATFPGYEKLGDMQVDFLAPLPGSNSIAPSGLVEVSRTEDIMGNYTVQNQYNFSLFFVFYRPEGGEETEDNAEWVLNFQEWVQEQDIRGKTPTFGNRTISTVAQNGMLYTADEEGTGVYMVQLSVNYEKRFEVI